MQKLTTIFLLALGLGWAGCQKDSLSLTPVASLKIVNTVTGGSPVKVGRYLNQVPINGNADFTLEPRQQDLYVWPVGDSLKPYYYGRDVLVAPSEILTLFLCGTTEAPEGILVRENLMAHQDSVAGIRFANLSPGSDPVYLTISASPGSPIFSNVDYRKVTGFKLLPATGTHTVYTFEVRSVSNPDVVLASHTMSGVRLASFVPRFRNVTLVYRGVAGGTPATGITRVNHYLVY